MFYNTIILVIASHSFIYDCFISYWREIMKSIPLNENKFKIFFLFSDPTLSVDILLKDDCIFVKGEESLEPGILEKTMAALQYCDHHFDYNFIIRTNLSSFWNLYTLHDYLETISRENMIGSSFMQYLDRKHCDIYYRYPSYFSLIDSIFTGTGKQMEHFHFLDGAGFLLSRDMVRLLILPVPFYTKLLSIPDDVAITIALLFHLIIQEKNIPFQELFVLQKFHALDFLPNEIYEANKSVVFIRNKSVKSFKDPLGTRRIDILNFYNQYCFYYVKN